MTGPDGQHGIDGVEWLDAQERLALDELEEATADISEFREIAEWDWVTEAHRSALHHVAEADWPAADRDWYATGRTTCGRGEKGALYIAGIFTRMGAVRCPVCCKALGYPYGTGSPKNDPTCRPLVEARLSELRREQATSGALGRGKGD